MRNFTNDSPLVSFCIATRNRVEKLQRLILSFLNTADDPSCFEVCIRVSRDDPATLSVIQELMNLCQLRVVIGYPMSGYPSVCFFNDEATRLALGAWTWSFDDDMVLIGKGWDTQLRQLPLEGIIVQPEIERLNTSGYHHHEGGPIWCVPNRCWAKLGHPVLQFPCDIWIDKLLRVDNKWKTHFLKGITVWHDRDKRTP